jgi:hypothetical protein
LKYVRVPELVCTVSFAALSVPCYREAESQLALADSIEATDPGQSEYIRDNAALPQGLGNMFAGTAAVTSLLSFRRRGDREETK